MIRENVVTFLNHLYFRHRTASRQYREGSRKVSSSPLKMQLARMADYRQRMAEETLELLRDYPSYSVRPTSMTLPDREDWESALHKEQEGKIRLICRHKETSLGHHLEEAVSQREWSRQTRKVLENQLVRNRQMILGMGHHWSNAARSSERPQL